MCCENESDLTEKLRQFIYDEDRVVTVVWLSNKLHITTDKSKSLLESFVANERKLNPDNLGVSYVLSGKLSETEINSIIAVEEHNVTKKKQSFNNISSEFIFSVQNSKNVDLDCVSMIDMLNLNDPIEKPVLGSIIGANCVKRVLKEKKVLPTVYRAPPTDKGKASHLFDKTSSIKQEGDKSGKEDVVKQGGKTATEVKAKQEVKASTSSTKVNKSVKPINQKGGIASFFSKVPIKPEIKKEATNMDQDSKTKEKLEEKPAKEESMEVDQIKNEETTKNKLYDSGTDEEAKKLEETNKNKTPKPKKSTKRPRKNKNNEQTSKRKRIIEENNSDSDDMFGDEKDTEEPLVVEVSDDEPAYKKPATPVLAPKNKRRKIVDKTYTDEEGYLITRQEWVYESGSDNEEDKEQKNPQIEKQENPQKEKKVEPAVKEKKSVSSQESTPPPKGSKGKRGLKPATNQPTLMNFFKKK